MNDCRPPHSLRQRFDAHRALFLAVKRLNFVEKCAFHGRRPADECASEAAALVQRARELGEKIPSFDLAAFAARFGLKDEVYALDRLRRAGERRQPLVEAAFLARDLLDLLVVYRADPRVAHFKSEYRALGEKLAALSQSAAARLSAELSAFRGDGAQIDARELSGQLNESEYEKFAFNVEQLYKSLYQIALKA